MNLRHHFISKFVNDNFDDYRFLWPSKFNQDGPWTHKIDPNEMSRVLNLLQNAMILMRSLKNIDKNYILYDSQNTILKGLINKH